MFIPIEFQKVFQKTEQTAISIRAEFTEQPNILGSRFGGNPYWEAENDMFVDENDKPLSLLVQINFSELPKNEMFPDSGILQIFMPRDNDYYGANLDDISGENQIVTQFWESPSADKSGGWDADIDDNDLVPVFGAHTLTFSNLTDYAGIETYECAEVLDANPFEVLEDVALNEKEESLFYDAIVDYVPNGGHKLLGYPSFINGDPRENSDYRLLLQIDTDMADNNDIMWGDNGIGHIFIRDVDLKAGRFDKVSLFWDY